MVTLGLAAHVLLPWLFHHLSAQQLLSSCWCFRSSRPCSLCRCCAWSPSCSCWPLLFMIRLPHLLLLFHLCLPKGPAALPALHNPPLQAAAVAATPAPTIPPALMSPRATLILMLFLFSVLHSPALHAAAAPALSSRAALHLAVASTLHGPALSVHLGTASPVQRIMDHPKASATTMAISASETSFNARHASPAAPDPPPEPATSPPPLPLPPRVARDLDAPAATRDAALYTAPSCSSPCCCFHPSRPCSIRSR